MSRRHLLEILVVMFAGVSPSLHMGSLLGAELTVTGKLTYLVVNKIHRLDLRSLSREIAYQHDAPLSSDFSRISDDEFVVSSIAGQLYLVKRGERAVEIGRGGRPLYLSKHRMLFFYSTMPGEHIARLFGARLEKGMIQAPRQIEGGPFYASPTPVAVSDDEVVFSHRINRTWVSFVYDVTSETTRRLPIGDCRPIAWRSVTRELICIGNVATWAVTLDGGKISEMPKLNGVGLGPISSDGTLMLVTKGHFSASHGGEVSDLLLYEFSSRKFLHLAEDVSLVSGTGYWSNN